VQIRQRKDTYAPALMKQQEYSYGEKELSNIDKIKRKERRERKENRTLYLVTLL
jgi:hypothetical protein